MNTRRTLILSTAIFSLTIIAPVAHAQGRGMRSASSSVRGGTSVRANRGGDFNHRGGRRFENGFGFPFAPFFYPDYYDGRDADYDYNEAAPEAPPVQTRPVQVTPPAPPPPPGDTLILENHDGQWVRIPTGAERLKVGASAQDKNVPEANSQVVNEETAASKAFARRLPPAVLVFRDGHSEEVQKYVIQGTTLYVTSAYSTTGSWTAKIPLADLDVPASLKVNNDRGTKFNLPSGPNEVVIRF
jgi:hypothetical protein